MPKSLWILRKFGEKIMYLYTKRGTYHKGNGLKSGDVVYGVDDGTLAVLTLADGVSSCAYGDIGARLITSMAIKYVHNQYSRLGFLPNEWATVMLNSIQKDVKHIASLEKQPYEEYSSTLIVTVVDREKGEMNYCTIGDGLILSISDKKCPVICMPQGDKDGCPVFTTKGIENAIETGSIKLNGIENVLICSDGTWNIMYRQNIMRQEIKQILINKNFMDFKECINSFDSADDCSFAIADVRRAV